MGVKFLEMEHDSSNVDGGASNAVQAADSSEQTAKTGDDIEEGYSKAKQVTREEIGDHPTVNHPSNRLPAIFVSMIEGHACKCDNVRLSLLQNWRLSSSVRGPERFNFTSSKIATPSF